MRTKVEVFVVLCLLGLAFQYALRLKHSEGERVQAERVRDSLFMEDAGNKASLDGWSVKFGTLQKDINAEFAHRDSMAARLVGDLNKAHARIRSLVEVVAVLKDSLVSTGTPGDTTSTGAVTYHGAINDGLLDAAWRFLAPSLSLAYRVSVPLEIITSEGGDGRWLVTARAKDPRASVSVGEFWFNPPAPVKVDRCTLKQTGWRVGIGALAGILVPR